MEISDIHIEQFCNTYTFKKLTNNLRFKIIDNHSYDDIFLKNHHNHFETDLCNLTTRVKRRFLKQVIRVIKHRHCRNFDDNRELFNLLKKPHGEQCKDLNVKHLGNNKHVVLRKTSITAQRLVQTSKQMQGKKLK